jgi:hypothetical protein
MVTQYPDTAVFAIPGTPAQDLDGNWYVPDPTTLTTTCRAEYNSKQGTVQTRDGQVVQYDYTVYQPVHTTEIAPGTQVVVTTHAGRVIEGTVKRHENNQLNSKSWV